MARTGRPVVVSALAAALLVLVAMVRIASTWSQLSETADEPAHVRAGLEWLDVGTFRWNPVDPPLSRLPAAIGPYLSDVRFSRPGVAPARGLPVDALDSDDPTLLRRARMGVLPFFALTAAMVWWWAKRAGGPLVALLAVGIVSLDPVVLGHAALATTDMENTAAFVGALLAFVCWWEAPSRLRSLVAGALLGVALASKLVALVLPACALAAALVLTWGGVARPPRRTLALHAGGALGVALLVLWASYRFSVGALDGELSRATLARFAEGCTSLTCRGLQSLSRVSLPAPDWLYGLRELDWEERDGHPSYLLGTWRMSGFGAYYLVALLVKTPLPELLLALGGLVLAVRVRSRAEAGHLLAPVAAAITLVAAASLGHVNIGVRHVLPVYPLLAVVEASALAALIRDVSGPRANRLVARVLAAALVIALVAGSVAAHPDYLASFNATVGDDGDRVLLDSDLDWGQDLFHLEQLLRERGVDRLHLVYFGPAVLERHALPPHAPLERNQPVTGWLAISAMYRRSPGFEWLDAYQPVARAGRSIYLYNILATP